MNDDITDCGCTILPGLCDECSGADDAEAWAKECDEVDRDNEHEFKHQQGIK